MSENSVCGYADIMICWFDTNIKQPWYIFGINICMPLFCKNNLRLWEYFTIGYTIVPVRVLRGSNNTINTIYKTMLVCKRRI